MKPTILVDLDNTTYSYDRLILKQLHSTHPKETITSQDIWDCFYNHEKNISYRQEVFDIAASPKFFFELPLIRGAEKGIALLQDFYDVQFCTIPTRYNPLCVEGKYASVARDFGVEMAVNMIVTRDKTAHDGYILLDDIPKVKGAREPNWTHIVFAREYNKECNPRTDWHEISELKGNLEAMLSSSRPSSSPCSSEHRSRTKV